MIGVSLFRKQVVITVVVTLFFLVLGQLASRMSTRIDHERVHRDLPLFISGLLDEVPPSSRMRELETIVRVGHGHIPFDPELLATDGALLYPPGKLPASLHWDPQALPKQAGEIVTFHEKRRKGEPVAIVRLPGEPAQYLLFVDARDAAAHSGFFFASLGYMFASVVLASVLSLFLLFYGMRERARLANSVISELQRGNLKARFPIKKLDEIGQAMLSFNRMADEIERLVERVQTTEQARMALLQELAHDLRTPVASLKSLLETLFDRRDQLDERLSSELLSLSLKEVDYFERLVEDLLFLARVSEPRYKAASESVRIGELLEEEIETGLSRHAARGIQVRRDFTQAPATIPGDTHLLRRLLRNALDNALSLAHREVSVRVLPGDGANAIVIQIEDDGPGLSEDALAAFGKRRVSRIVEGANGGRLSVGLGSVIMKTIVQLHRGELAIENRAKLGETQLGGASLRITMPLKQ